MFHYGTQSKHPCLIAAVTAWPSEHVEAIHMTFLNYDGEKIDHEKNKLRRGSCPYGAVRLGKPSKKLYLAEGIETALSVIQITGDPCWAVLSATSFKPFHPPESVKEILIAADNDCAGTNNAKIAASHFSRLGFKAYITTPDETGADFNDFLNKGVGSYV